MLSGAPSCSSEEEKSPSIPPVRLHTRRYLLLAHPPAERIPPAKRDAHVIFTMYYINPVKTAYKHLAPLL